MTLIVRQSRPILGSILPAFIVGIGYLVLCGYRRDYLGHYAAGFGATLVVLAIAVDWISPESFARRGPLAICLWTLACIAAGVYTELTVFNLAKFDEVDFCNQSLGAALAGLGFLTALKVEKPPASFFRIACLAGLVALLVGFYFAMF